MRRLPPPTPRQLGCVHQWHVTNTQANFFGYPAQPWPKTRYVECVRCGLRTKTVETVAVEWAVHHRS